MQNRSLLTRPSRINVVPASWSCPPVNATRRSDCYQSIANTIVQLLGLYASGVIASSQAIQSGMRNRKTFRKEFTMTIENVLYTANAHTRGGRENGTAPTDDGRLDIRLSPAAVSSIFIFTAGWRKWFCVLRHCKGFGLFDSVRFGLWLARGEAGATASEESAFGTRRGHKSAASPRT